jgi:hypothetical protein
MPNYLFIESRGRPHDTFGCTTASALARGGSGVVLLLVQNATLAARHGAYAPQLDEAAEAGVALLADEFALRERGIARERLRPGVEPAPIDVVIDRLVDGWHVIWH